MLLKLMTLVSALFAAGVCALVGGFASLAWLWLLPAGLLGGFALCLMCCVLAVWIPSLFIDPGKPQEESRYVRTIVKLYAPAVFQLLGCRVEAEGTEKLPKDGRFVLVCNHTSNFDPGIPLAVFPDAQLAFISKKENLELPIIGKMMLKIQCQLLDRENDRAALKTILKCISILKEDKASIGVFPEGGIIKDGKLLHHFRPGVFKIAQKANVPIVVCTIQNTRMIFKNLAKLKKTDVALHLVDVIPAEDLKGKTTVEIADRIYEMMIADLGEEFRS